MTDVKFTRWFYFRTWLYWIFYCMITQEDRLRYIAGKNKGMYCYKVEHSKCILNEYTDYYYDPNRKPVREFLNRKEFFEVNKQRHIDKHTQQ